MKKEKDETIVPKANIVGETNKEILEKPVSEEDIKNATEIEVEQANTILNPDPHSLDSRG